MLKITGIVLTIALFTVLEGAAFAGNDIIIDKNAAKTFATLPDGVAFPEGIAANPLTGETYVSTFNLNEDNKLLRFAKNGRLLSEKDFGGTPLLGLAFNNADKKIYICNFGLSKIQRIDAHFDETSTVEDVAVIPGIGAPENRTEMNPDGSEDTIVFGSNNFPAPNGLVFDSKGNLFISDSFQGAIFGIEDAANCLTESQLCAVNLIMHDGKLATASFPPFGANGLALSEDETTLFIANTGDDRVLTLDLETVDSDTDPIETFAESINGADGIAFDEDGRLWVVANQSDQILVLDEMGIVVAKLGENLGIQWGGSPRGLLFPASLVILGKWVYVTNLALPLTPAEGDEPEEFVSKYTVSRIKIPKNSGWKWHHPKH